MLNFNPFTGSLDSVGKTFNETFGSVFIEAPYSNKPLIITVPINLRLDQVVGATVRVGSLNLSISIFNEESSTTTQVLNNQLIAPSSIFSSLDNLEKK